MLTGAFSPSLGIQPAPLLAWAIARVAFNAYEVGQFDIARADASTVNDLTGHKGSIFAGVIKPTSGGIISGFLGVWQQNVSAGGRGRIMLWGKSTAKIIKASGDVARADQLVANTDGYLSPDHAIGDRIIATALDPLTAPTTATEAEVLFNGIFGLGQFVS
jgi:hypothetical protein